MTARKFIVEDDISLQAHAVVPESSQPLEKTKCAKLSRVCPLHLQMQPFKCGFPLFKNTSFMNSRLTMTHFEVLH